MLNILKTVGRRVKCKEICNKWSVFFTINVFFSDVLMLLFFFFFFFKFKNYKN